MTNAADFSRLNAYLVGGAVRDARLGRAVGDRDWVVVGSSVAEMLELGFTQVGRDFPVFLHPQTHEEYALARTERKQGSGHTGFVVHADSEVTLEEDLKRRDLTINAMAENPNGTLIDPYGGLADIESRILRHVSAAFGEDPLRVLRVARFAAILPDFRVAPETAALMADMCRADALAELSAERVWQELVRALAAPAPERFFEVLDACGGLGPWFTELAGVQLRFSTADALHRFAELPLDDEALPRLCGRLKAPKQFVEAAQDWRRYGELLRAADRAQPAELVDALEALRAHHDTRRLEFVLDHLQHSDGVDQTWLLAVAGSLADVGPTQNIAPGPAYGRALREARAARLAQAQQQR